jgi:ferredoxin
LYYFSATGNTLSIAKRVQSSHDDTTLIALPTASTKIEAEHIGLLFPIHAWGVPSNVLDFLERADLEKVRSVVAIASCAGIGGGSLLRLDRLLRKKNRSLSAGFFVKEPANTIHTEGPDAMQRFIRFLKRSDLPATLDEQLPDIVRALRTKEQHAIAHDGFVVDRVSGLLNRLARKRFPEQDRLFIHHDTCTACGLCEAICPVDNIRLQNGEVTWQHNCLFCMACLHICPQEAIDIGDATKGKARYRKVGISTEDLVVR